MKQTEFKQIINSVIFLFMAQGSWNWGWSEEVMFEPWIVYDSPIQEPTDYTSDPVESKKHIEKLEREAKSGAVEALHQLGLYYYNGIYVEQNDDVARKYLQKAADQLYPRSIYQLALFEEDSEKKRALLIDAAELGFTTAFYTLFGMVDEKNEAEQLYYYEKLAENGQKMAFEWLLDYYDDRLSRDLLAKKVLHWYEKWAETGDSRGVYRLAAAYRWGDEWINANLERTIQLYQQGVDAGLGEKAPRFYYDLANAYLVKGDLTLKEKAHIIELYKKAMKVGDRLLRDSARRHLGIFYEQGKIVTQDYEKALIYWREYAENKGFYRYDKNDIKPPFTISNAVMTVDEVRYIADALIRIAHHYEGFRDEKSQSLAQESYSLAAKAGNEEGLNQLTIFAQQGDEESRQWVFNYYKRYPLLVDWMEAEAIEGDAKAQYEWGKYQEDHSRKDPSIQYWKDLVIAGQMDWYLKSAKQGYPPAIERMGDYYFQSKNSSYRSEDRTASIRWYSKFVELADADQAGKMASKLGDIYEKGDIVPRSHKKAMEWYKKGAELGDRRAKILLCEENRLHNLFLNAEKGDADALYQLSQLSDSDQRLSVAYQYGELERSQERLIAKEYYRKAIEAGYKIPIEKVSRLNRGYIMDDQGKVFVQYRKAAEQGDHRAQELVGDHSLYGIGVEANREKAREWYKKSLKSGRRSAHYSLYSMNQFDQTLALAEQDDIDAAEQLGYFYSNGIGVKVEQNEACRWYEVAALAGSALGQSGYGKCLEAGIYVAQDYNSARQWYQKSAQEELIGKLNLAHLEEVVIPASKGDLNAVKRLGDYYLSLRPLRDQYWDHNYRIAFNYYEKAAKAGNIDAQIALGKWYLTNENHFFDYVEDRETLGYMWLEISK